MFENFFSQVELADRLGFGTAWVAETHLSCQIQKHNKHPVIPHFMGEIGLNTDILQLAHRVFARTRRIHIGSAVRNILCNGGPIAHAEAISTFLALHGLDPEEERRLEIGFASGRFEFSNRPYGIKPRSEFEQKHWAIVKGKILNQATEIFLRLLRGEQFSSETLKPQVVVNSENQSLVTLNNFYEFEKLGLVPRELRRELLTLTLGSHDSELQIAANRIWPTRVFNLSITPPEVIEQTHQRLSQYYHPQGGSWQRWMMPRTALIFIDDTAKKAKERAEQAWRIYWTAMEGTLDPRKVKDAVDNTLSGDWQELTDKIKQKYHPEDRLMLWFDFNNHDNEAIKKSMTTFMEKVAPNAN